MVGQGGGCGGSGGGANCRPWGEHLDPAEPARALGEVLMAASGSRARVPALNCGLSRHSGLGVSENAGRWCASREMQSGAQTRS